MPRASKRNIIYFQVDNLGYIGAAGGVDTGAARLLSLA
jgi:hypothetical protein